MRCWPFVGVWDKRQLHFHGQTALTPPSLAAETRVLKRYWAPSSELACEGSRPRDCRYPSPERSTSLVCFASAESLCPAELLSHRPRIESCCWEETIHIRLPATSTTTGWLRCVAASSATFPASLRTSAKQGGPLVSCLSRRDLT